MKTLLRLGGVLLLIVLSAWVAVPAQAGGPTSVMLSAPGIPKVVATGYQDAKYATLMQSVGMQAKDHPGWKEGSVTRVIRATWLIHDMSVWRLDMIYPDAEGGPWVATWENDSSGKLPDKPIWHPAADGVALTKVLGELGLLSQKGYEANDSTANDGATPEVAVTDDVPATAAAAATTSDSNAFTGWRWAVPGALVGAVLALVAVKAWPRRRWELIDQE
jgi:hypothetical protein